MTVAGQEAIDFIQGTAKAHCILNDCGPVLSSLPDGCVDAVITDWPYDCYSEDCSDPTPYHQIHDFLRISRGVVVVFGSAPHLIKDAKSLPIPPDRTLIWAPAFTLSHTQCDDIFYRFHPIYCWRIPKDHEGPTQDVLRHNTMRHCPWKHSCTKPEDLMAALAGFAPTGGVILDPYAGAGSTGVGGLRKGRRVLLVEREEVHVETCRGRIAAELSGVDYASMVRGQIPMYAP